MASLCECLHFCMCVWLCVSGMSCQAGFWLNTAFRALHTHAHYEAKEIQQVNGSWCLGKDEKTNTPGLSEPVSHDSHHTRPHGWLQQAVQHPQAAVQVDVVEAEPFRHRAEDKLLQAHGRFGTRESQRASENNGGKWTHHRSGAAQAETEDVAKVHSVSNHAAEIQALTQAFISSWHHGEATDIFFPFLPPVPLC